MMVKFYELLVVAGLLVTRLGRRRDERGDVPGWVFVAVMSVGLVTAIGALAGDELQRLLRQALRSVG